MRSRIQTLGTDVVVFAASASGNLAINTWYHILASWNTDALVDVNYVYLNDVDIWSDATTNTVNNQLVGYERTNAEVQIGGGDLIGAPLQGCMSQVWFDSNTFLDITIEANRRKFINADGSPVALGPDGSVPTGTSPLIYLDNPVTTFHINRGTGGDFEQFGSPDNCDDAPADGF